LEGGHEDSGEAARPSLVLQRLFAAPLSSVYREQALAAFGLQMPMLLQVPAPHGVLSPGVHVVVHTSMPAPPNALQLPDMHCVLSVHGS
jgi:hypothetical protein